MREAVQRVAAQSQRLPRGGALKEDYELEELVDGMRRENAAGEFFVVDSSVHLEMRHGDVPLSRLHTVAPGTVGVLAADAAAATGCVGSVVGPGDHEIAVGVEGGGRGLWVVPVAPGDVRSAEEAVTLQPGEIRLVATGLAMELPEGMECQVRPRSGLALKHGITLPNSPGTIDPDYRGELRVIMQNLGSEPVTLERGERIAQLVFARFERPAIRVVESVSLETKRGEGGFGSTGED